MAFSRDAKTEYDEDVAAANDLAASYYIAAVKSATGTLSDVGLTISQLANLITAAEIFGPTYDKEPAELVDIHLDLEYWLDGDTISGLIVTATGDIVVNSYSYTDTVASVWLSGGSAGAVYQVTFRISTAGGRTDDRTINIAMTGVGSWTKDPDAVLDYVVDFTTWLAGDTISSATVTVPAGITKDSDSNTTTAVTMWLSGGTDGIDYDIVIDITTAGGRSTSETVTIQVRESHTAAGFFAAPLETVTAANVITAAENCKTFVLSSATEFASTLPAPSAGLKYRFIVGAAPSGASYTIATDSGDNVLQGLAVVNGATVACASQDTITFTDGAAVVGDWVEVTSDGTSWFVAGQAQAATGIAFSAT